MRINELIQTFVGPDLSRPPPMYRPSLDVPNIRIILLHAIIMPIADYELTLHLADTSAVAAINRALRGWRVRSHDPCYFVQVHYRPSVDFPLSGLFCVVLSRSLLWSHV